MVPLPAAASGDLLPPLPPFSGFNFFSSVETPAQFVYDTIEMTDCIFQAINSNMQASISVLREGNVRLFRMTRVQTH
jgi:hypothetical protein